MHLQAVALSCGVALRWVRVGELLDAAVAHRPDEVVQRIVSIASGFRVETRDPATGTVRCYEAPSMYVSQVEPLQEDAPEDLDDRAYAASVDRSPILKANLSYGVERPGTR